MRLARVLLRGPIPRVAPPKEPNEVARKLDVIAARLSSIDGTIGVIGALVAFTTIAGAAAR